MAGRKWVRWGDPVPPATGGHPRPSERRGAGQREQPRPPKRQKTPEELDPQLVERMRARLEPPKAPWAPLPLAELAIVFGMLAGVIAAIRANTDGVIAAFALILLGTVEFSWREHRHGYRPHSTVLAGSAGMLLAMGLWKLAGAPRIWSLAAGAALFLVAWGLLSRSFERDPRLG